MEYYTSDSCDSDSRDQKTVDLSGRLLSSAEADDQLAGEDKKPAEQYEIMFLYNNRMAKLPDTLMNFINLKVLDVSNNNLESLPDVLDFCPSLTSLIAKNNSLKNCSLPKTFTCKNRILRELNLSGNMLMDFPEQVLELANLKYLYLGSNKISNIPCDIWKLTSLQILCLGNNRISSVPASVGRLASLQALVLAKNQLRALPASVANLAHLRSLLLHDNKLRTLPTEIITLKCLNELSLRDNPLVVRFARAMSLTTPRLMELAGRAVWANLSARGIYDPPSPPHLPRELTEYLDTAERCVNPECRGVFFDTRVEHIKFVDFCGKYRVPLLQYLCSTGCAAPEPWSLSAHAGPSTSHMMRKVLLG